MAQAYNKSINQKCNCWISGGSPSVRLRFGIYCLQFRLTDHDPSYLNSTQRKKKLGITDLVSKGGGIQDLGPRIQNPESRTQEMARVLEAN